MLTEMANLLALCLAAAEPGAIEPEEWRARATLEWMDSFGPLVVKNLNTGIEGTVRLYGNDGEVEPVQLEEFARIAASAPGASGVTEPHLLGRRLVQLAVKAAYHFGGAPIVLISGFRAQTPWRGSRHAIGEALDFQLEGIKAPLLAMHLRSYPRVGVGLYTHPRTQYVHLDVREESYHWLDGSPPGVTWREQPLPVYWRLERDAAYRPSLDLPAAR